MPRMTLPRRRHVLVADVTEAASEISRLINEARDLDLPVEPDVREGRNALVRWAVLCVKTLSHSVVVSSKERL
jgi:hypothetical protein